MTTDPTLFAPLYRAAQALGSAWASQIAGTFLAAGSSFSLGALALSLVVFVMLAIPAGRRRRVRPAVLIRVLVPRRLFGSASGRADAALFAGGLLFAGLAIGWAMLSADRIGAATVATLGTLIGAHAAPSLPASAVTAIATLLLFLAYEFAYWLDHALKHKVPLLWHFHKVHHQAESLSLLTNGRVHPVDTIVFFNIVAVVSGLTGGMLRYAFGANATPLAIGGTNLIVMTTAILVTHLQHSHLWIGFGPRWGRWFLGAAHHQIHHSSNPAHFDRNFGSTLALFDRLFRTFHQPGARPPNLRFGVDDGETAPHGARALLVQPFMGVARDATTIVRRAGRRIAIGAASRT